MRNDCSFDERQQWLRAEAMKHGLLFMGLMILLDAFLKSDIITSEGITLVEGMWGNILIVVLTITICQIEMILRGAINLDDRRNRIMNYFYTVIGIVLLVWITLEHFISGTPLFHLKTLTGDGTELFMSICWLLIGITGIIKSRQPGYEEGQL
jgi:hypothetical protein